MFILFNEICIDEEMLPMYMYAHTKICTCLCNVDSDGKTSFVIYKVRKKIQTPLDNKHLDSWEVIEDSSMQVFL